MPGAEQVTHAKLTPAADGLRRARRRGVQHPPLLSCLVVLLAGGCVTIEGGAVEARWVLRNTRGVAVDCADEVAQIAAIRFALLPVASGDDPCAVGDACRFSCRSGVGTTPFVIPAGRYAISLRPLDADGEALALEDGVQVPAAILREVRLGELTNLNVNLIIVDR